MVLGVVISKVFEAGVPFDVELFACNLVGNPKIAHFHGSGALAFYGVVRDAGGGRIIAVYGRWWLWVTEFLQDEAKDASFFCVNKEGTKFGFGGR